MRILVANKFGFRRGGLERVMFDEMRWLAELGHEVALFTTQHPSNLPSEWSDYFVPYLELGEAGGLSASQRAVAAARMFHNGVAEKLFARLLDDFRPDIVHAHGIHRQISPSILSATVRREVPVVQTLHDYHHVCPADTLLYRGVEPCQPRRCGVLWYGAAVSGRCVRGSLAASALSAAETSWARARRAYERGVRRFISPSNALAEVMTAGAWRLPLDVVPNASPEVSARGGVGSGFVVVGRIAREKGVPVAIEAARQAGVRLTVIGTGPLEEELRAAYPEVSFTGHLDAAATAEAINGARAVVVPSVWLENASMTVLEALGSGVPVIGSAIGGIPEQVTHEVDGLLVAPSDVGALARALERLDGDAELAARLGARAYVTARERFSPGAHVAGVLRSYDLAIGAT